MTLDTFGARFLHVLRQKGLSQAQAAKLLDTTPGFLSDVVNDVKSPGLEFLVRAQQVLEVSIDWLVTGVGFQAHAPFDLDVYRLFVGIGELVKGAAEGDEEAVADLEQLMHVAATEPFASSERLDLLKNWSHPSDVAMVAAAIQNSVPASLSLDERLKRALSSAVAMWQLWRHESDRNGPLGRSGRRTPESEVPPRQAFRNVQLVMGHTVKAAAGNYIDRSTTYEESPHAGSDPTRRRR
jgi:transcriptional regulator with XRE-family HTH domain